MWGLTFLREKTYERVILLDYVIKNHKNVYIRLSENGKPVTCCEGDKALFEYSKARNIVESLPKTLRRLNFKVICIPDTRQSKKYIQKDKREVSDDIKRWVEKFGTCGDTINEAKERLDFLVNELKIIDGEFIDILHIIELENSKDLYGGWLKYKHIRQNRERRREIKDEILIIENVLEEINPSSLRRDRIQKAVDGLLNRKYTFRIVEEETVNGAL